MNQVNFHWGHATIQSMLRALAIVQTPVKMQLRKVEGDRKVTSKQLLATKKD